MKSQLYRVCFAVVVGWCSATVSEDTRPNILWLVAEDMSPDMGCYGDAYAYTPNLDALAAEGARYRHAFSVSGVCAPSRSAIITGMYPTTLGSHHMRSSAVPPAYVKCFSEYIRAAGYYCTNNAKTDYNFSPDEATRGTHVPLGAWDESSRNAHWRNRPAGIPFFSVFNFNVSHESQIRVPDERFARVTTDLPAEARHDPDAATLPPYYPDDPRVRQDWARYYDLVSVMDMQVAEVLAQLEADGLAENTIVFFYGDHGRGLPRAKRWVYDSGIQVPLIVRWPGAIAPGIVDDEFVTFLDFAPTLLSIAGAEVPEHMQGRVFLGGERQPAPQYIFAARDRMDETYDIIRAVRDKRFKYIRNFEPDKPYAQHIAYMDQMPTMQVWREWAAEGKLTGPQTTFFLPRKPKEELYHIGSDPHETINLADAPDHAQTLKHMRALLETWMKETGDLGLVPEDKLIARMRPKGEAETTTKPAWGINDADPFGWRCNLHCETPGATIVYAVDNENPTRWLLYTEPFEVRSGAKLIVKAGRLGYYDSEPLQITLP